MKISSNFDVKLNIRFGKFKKELKNKVGEFWVAIDNDFIPFSFLSEKGSFLFKLIEGDDIDTWCLIVPNNKKILNKFLDGKITYKDFFENVAENFYLVEWNINNGQLKIKEKIEKETLLILTKYIHKDKIIFK